MIIYANDCRCQPCGDKKLIIKSVFIRAITGAYY